MAATGMTRRRTASIIALACAATLGGAGCGLEDSDSGSSGRRERPRYEQRERYEERRERPRYDDYDRERPGRDRLSEPKARAEGIPEAARLMEEGKGVIRFRPTRDGQVFVEDTHDLKLLLETQLYEGETLTVDPDEDVLAVNSKALGGPKRLRKLVNDHRHRIYFYPDRTQRTTGSRLERGVDRDIRY